MAEIVLNDREERLIFFILFAFCFTFGLGSDFYIDIYSSSYGIYGAFFMILPFFFIIKINNIYIYIFLLYLMIILNLFFVINIGAYVSFKENNLFSEIWQMLVILSIIDIYYGFKIIIKEHLNYRKLDPEEKKKLCSGNEIARRVSYFFICIAIFIIWFGVTNVIGEYVLSNWY